MTFEIGQTVGDYRIISVLGRGGMGAVYRVRNTLTDREEAMKVVLPGAEGDAADRFLREIRIQASLQHPHIASIRTAFRAEGSVLMIMELIEGVPLDQKLRDGPLPLGDVFRIIDDILGALAHAHAKGIVHRDIKPSNIIVTPRGAPKLTDFGIATVAGDQRITRSGMAVGSLAYMSPEQVMSKPFDERSDVYSLGITVYEALTGRRPFRSDSEFEIMNAHLHEAPMAPGAILRSIPLAISVVVLKSLAKAPEDRYQTAAEFQGAWRQAFFGGSEETETMILPQPPAAAPKIDPKDLARVESGLVRLLGPIGKSLVAKAAVRHHTLETLSRHLAGEIPREEDRTTFLKACGVSSGSHTTPSGSQKTAPIEEKTLEAARKALAPSLGPIAAMVVSRTAKRVHSAEELRDALAAEIPDEKDRKKFLAAFHAS
ncbi:MAG: serine/threonine-protein kinase [Bryobacteraceae bacterium]